ncbi:MAG: cupin domain-containing protein [Deferribacterales bacterium]
MIVRGNDIEPKKMERPRDGRGEAINLAYSALQGLEGRIKVFSVVDLAPDSMVGYHQHIDDMEIYLMLDGTGVVNDNGNVDIIRPGDMLITNFGEWHSIENKSSTPITFLAIIIEK